MISILAIYIILLGIQVLWKNRPRPSAKYALIEVFLIIVISLTALIIAIQHLSKSKAVDKNYKLKEDATLDLYTEMNIDSDYQAYEGFIPATLMKGRHEYESTLCEYSSIHLTIYWT